MSDSPICSWCKKIITPEDSSVTMTGGSRTVTFCSQDHWGKAMKAAARLLGKRPKHGR